MHNRFTVAKTPQITNEAERNCIVDSKDSSPLISSYKKPAECSQNESLFSLKRGDSTRIYEDSSEVCFTPNLQEFVQQQ